MWPLYMTVGNLRTEVRSKASHQAVVLLALLPSPIKMGILSAADKRARQIRNREVLQGVLAHVLRPFFDAGGCKFNALCADGQYRLCYSPLSAWIADYPEYTTLMQLRYGDCVWCETSTREAGDFPDRMAPFRDHALYERLLLDGKTEELTHRGVIAAHNVLWQIDAVVGDLPKPDLLHCMQLGILNHLLEWVTDFLQESQRLELFNQLWVSIPPYQDMLRPKKSFQEVGQWQGKEIKTMSRFLLACFAASLDNPPNNETRESFTEAILCVRAALEFYMYARYPSHTDTTLGYMSDSLRRFHDHKNVFSRYRADKKVRAAAKKQETEMIAEREAELRNSGLSATQKRNITTRWRSKIDLEKTKTLEDGGQFNLPKMHAMRHFVPQIERFGSLLGFDSSITEVSHKFSIKHGYNASNRNVSYTEQILNYNARNEQIATRNWNISVARQKFNSQNCDANKTRFAFPPKPASTLKSRQYEKGKGKIKTFRDLLAKVSLPQTHNTDSFYNLTHIFVDRQGFDLTRDDLLATPAALYHSLHVSVEDWQKYEWKIHNIRATNDREWMRSGCSRQDWVWVRQKASRQHLPYKALRGRLPAQVCFFFSLSIATHDKPREMVPLALVRVTEPVNSGTAENALAMPRVAIPTVMAKRYAVIHAGSIEGAAHVVPLVPDNEKNTRWIVNTHIDLETWNKVYEFLEE
jgi:hypothetical protein